MSGYTIPRYNRFCNSRAFGVLDKVHLSTGERHDLALSSWEVNASDIMCVPDIHQHWRLVAAVAQLPHATSRGARLEAAAEVLMLPPSVYHDFWRGDCSTPATGIAQPCRIPPLHLLGILRADKKWFLWMNDEKVLLVGIDVHCCNVQKLFRLLFMYLFMWDYAASAIIMNVLHHLTLHCKL